MSTGSDVSDEVLISRISEGDRAAFTQVYARHALTLLRYASTKVKTPEDAEEIVQEVFVSLWAKRHHLRNILSVRAYLTRAVTNGIFNYYRSGRVRQQYAKDFTLFLVAEGNGTEEELNLSDLQRIIEREINQLPERCQLAFRLSRFEHLPIPAIAERMNISTGTVENYITIALKHLRVSLRTR